MGMRFNDPRDLDPGVLPEFASAEEELRYVISLAALAPSTFNTQPWIFKINDNVITLTPDRTRQLMIIDPTGRELVISCGAALANLVVAARYLGFEGDLEKDGKHPLGSHPIARLPMHRAGPSRKRDELLFQAIPRRHSTRQPFNHRGISDLQLRRILDAMASDSVKGRVVEGAELRMKLAELAQANLQALGQQAERSEEAARWRLPRDSQRRDGLPQEALGMSTMEYLWHYLSGGEAGVNRKAARSLREKTEQSSRILVLTTATDEIHDWLEVGLAMERALLRAAAIGIQASFMGALTHSPEARHQTGRALESTRIPQLVLCLGHCDTRPATPRRPLEHLLRK